MDPIIKGEGVFEVQARYLSIPLDFWKIHNLRKKEVYEIFMSAEIMLPLAVLNTKIHNGFFIKINLNISLWASFLVLPPP
jgi:hypothetical protein